MILKKEVYILTKENIISYLILFITVFLQRRRWDVKFQETSQMLKEECECTTERITIGKHRPTVTIVKSFEKPQDDYKPKELKPKDAF